MASALQVDTAQVQLTFAVFLIAIAIAQFIWGPISDAVGRRPVFRAYSLMGGLVFGAMSVFFAASPALFIENLGVGPLE